MTRTLTELERGRQAYKQRAWLDAYTSLSSADGTAILSGDDLELLATSAYLIGREDEFLRALDRAHLSHLDGDRVAPAARCAFWLGFRLAARGDVGAATGWLARAKRLLGSEPAECVEHGYLLLPTAEQQLAAGDYEEASGQAASAAEIANRFGDADLLAYAVHLQGRALLRRARVAEGLALLDEAMVTVSSEQVFPPLAGVIYCSVIEACRSVFALKRAQEWTDALAGWCKQQPDMVAYTGQCLIYRAEILQLHGAWREALEEAQRAGERCTRSADGATAAGAFFRIGEIHRLRGELDAADRAYRMARERGFESQPGVALLRLAQGKTAAAAASIRRVCSETTDRSRRARLLPAYVEIMLAVTDAEGARRGCTELEEIAASHAPSMLSTVAAHARGALALADGQPQAALVALRSAMRGWQDLDAPYEAARVRLLVALACRALADEETAVMELETARAAFQRLGAAPDMAIAAGLIRGPTARDLHGLSRRELEVLRLVAAGKSNKSTAAELLISEKTVERHLTNMFRKLGVSSRTAAAGYAFEHNLL